MCAINGRRSGADAWPRGPRCAAPRACAVPRRRLPGLTPNEAPRRRPQAKTSFVLPLEEAKRGLLLLKEAGSL
uniref:Radical S-adenosyl methionine domain containing 2 n=1 Tax=Homo sapiens TaxID=9606 RepID=A0A7P0Z4E2_HUMAN